MLAAVGHGDKAGVFLILGLAHAVAQRIPSSRRHGTDDHGHGLAGVDAVGAKICIVVAGAALNVALVVVDLKGAGVDVQYIAHEREINKLTSAGLELVDIGKQRGGEKCLGTAGVADDRAYAGRSAVGLAGLCVYAAHCDGTNVIGRLVAVLRRLYAERGQRSIDYARVDLAHIFIAETELFHEAGLVGNEHNVKIFDLFENELLRIGVAELHFYRFFASVLTACIGRHAACIVGKPASGLAAGYFDLDDLCAVIGKVRADNWAGRICCKVKNLYAFEHFHIFFLL